MTTSPPPTSAERSLSVDLAIITVSYNTRNLLSACLQSVFVGLRRSELIGEVWVVDNGSADGSPRMVRERYPEVRLIAQEDNLGFASGNNLALERMGLEQATIPRHVLFLNPDTRVVDDALGELVRFLDSQPAAGVVGARLVHGDGRFQHSAFRFPGLVQIILDFFPVHHRVLDSRLNGRYPRRLYEGGSPFLVDHPLGAALMVRGETLAQVGPFDERFFMYCEEIDLCRRVWGAGWQVYCLPRAEIVHLVGRSTVQFRDKMFVALWRSRFLMFEKHHGALFCWLARRLVRLGLWAEARRATAAHRRADITADELAGRMAAYAEVAAL